MKNISTNHIKKTIEELKTNAEKGKKNFVVEAKWNSGFGPQIQSKLEFERGIALWETDAPSAMGGTGGKPAAIQYYLYSLTSCVMTTFAIITSLEGLELYSLSGKSECTFNLNSFLGINSDPIMENLKLVITVASKEKKEKLDDALELTLQRCPVAQTASRVPGFTAELVIES